MKLLTDIWGDHAKCYVPREKVTPFQAISLIHEGGGIAVFAHPILCRLDKDRLESLTAQLVRPVWTGSKPTIPPIGLQMNRQ